MTRFYPGLLAILVTLSTNSSYAMETHTHKRKSTHLHIITAHMDNEQPATPLRANDTAARKQLALCCSCCGTTAELLSLIGATHTVSTVAQECLTTDCNDLNPNTLASRTCQTALFLGIAYLCHGISQPYQPKQQKQMPLKQAITMHTPKDEQ